MKVLVSALEHSANIHLGELKKRLSDDVEFVGIFDEAYGNPIISLNNLAIMGFVDALKKLKFFIDLGNTMVSLCDKVDKVLLIDSSGFNLPLAKKIKKRYPDLEVIYYILPQAWAWKKKRIPVLEKSVDKLLSILPFEQNLYSKNAPIEYVGHPLLDEITRFKDAPTKHNRIAFMPGSRVSEIKRLMPHFKTLAQKLDQECVVIIPRHFTKAQINEFYGNLSQFQIAHNAHETLYESDFAFICSGTATLEASLIGVPFVLSYIAKKVDFMIAKHLVKLEYIGLGNILYFKRFGEMLHPEFIQHQVNADELYHAYKQFNTEEFVQKSLKLRKYLQNGSSERVAKIILGQP